MAWTPSPVALAAITVCVVAAAAGTGILLQPSKERAEPSNRGPNVSIAVVAPREPELQPGSVMDVGELADSYAHRGYVQPTIDRAPSYDAPEERAPAPVEMRRPERPRVVSPESPPPVIVERREGPRRWPFGFDQPGPDYAAERRERAARLDDQRRYEEERARERFEDDPDWRDDRGRDVRPDTERRGRERQWYSSDGRRAPDREPYD